MSKLTFFLRPLSVGFVLVLLITLTTLVISTPPESAAAEAVGVEEVSTNPDDGAARPPQQQPDGGSIWQDVDQIGIQSQGQRDIVPSKFRLVAADINALDSTLAQAPMEGTISAQTTSTELTLPMPDGTFQRFQIQEYAMMEPGLAAKFPEITNYLGQGIDDPTATVWLDRTPAGFHGMILSANGTVYIDPYSRGDIVNYMSYNKQDYGNVWGKSFQEELPISAVEEDLGSQDISAAASSGPTLRTYRLAMAATGEYTQFHGGTVAQALAAINTTVNRVNGIYQREFSVRMTLVANTNLVIYTDPTTDPYSNTSGDLTANQNTLDSVIGNGNYDIGHLVGTGGGGVASLASLCNTFWKGRGLTGSPNPVGDPFDVDFVAHEMGHQFGGNHTYNADNAGNCTTRVAAVAYEPGGGTTIMAYAGICTNQDIQSNSDDYFHGASFDEIMAHLTDTTATPGNEGGDSCAAKTATGNVAPAVNAGLDYTIPFSTPFVLTGSATDANVSGSLSYGWEQFELGQVWDVNVNPPTLPNTDADAARPIFRSYSPVTVPSRNFPVMANILDGTFANKGEILPVRARPISFRLTVRDNLGGVANDTANVTIDTTSGPFRVTAPAGGEMWNAGDLRTINWNVNNTDNFPVSCTTVDILMSTDGGQTFPTTILAGTPNDGSENVTIPGDPITLTKSAPTSIMEGEFITYTLVASNPGDLNAIIKVQCSNNIFFDASSITVLGTVANSILITDVVPANTVLVSVSDAGTSSGNNPGDTITWDTGANLVQNSSLTRTFVVSPTGGNVTNTGYVSATNASAVKTSNTVNTIIVTGVNYLPIIVKN